MIHIDDLQKDLHLSLSAAGTDTDGANVLTGPDREGGIEILFHDNGCGISEDHLGKMFDPFFTTKAVGKGTGLGLSISYGIIKDHKGRISVEETSPDGTTLAVFLPTLG